MSFKNTFCNKNRQPQKFVLNLKIWKFEFEIWIWNVTNQMIVFSAFIQSGYRGTRHHLSIQLVSFSVLENKQERRSFFWELFMPYNKSFVDQASSVKMAGYWPRSLFTYGLDFVEVHKNAKRELGQYPGILTSRLTGSSFGQFNRRFLSSPQPPFQIAAKCEVFVMRISFHSYCNWN